MNLYIDFETRSDVKIKDFNAWIYSEGKQTDIICMGYKLDDGPVKVWEPEDSIPEEVYQANRIVAHNALFEHAIIQNVLQPKYGFPKWMSNPRIYICTASMSRSCGLPGSLEKVADVLQVATQKLDIGKKLIQKYCTLKTKRTTKEKYFNTLEGQDKEDMLKYCKYDVQATYEIFQILTNQNNSVMDYHVFQADFNHNINGLNVVVDEVQDILDFIDVLSEKILDDMEKKFPGLLITSNKQLLEYLHSKDVMIDNLQADTLENLKNKVNDDIRELIEARLFLSKASIKKFKALKDLTSPDGKLRHFLKYYGAHTGRYSGQGFQPHNLPKSQNKDIITLEQIKNSNMSNVEIIQALKKLVPTMIRPDKDHSFIAGDFAAIEARVLAFITDEKEALTSYKNDEDLYIKMAVKIYHRNDINKQERSLGKAAVLGCGYGMGPDKFHTTCQGWGQDISLKLARETVYIYRNTFPKIPNFWRNIENAFKVALLENKEVKLPFLTIRKGKNRVEISLPGGRILYYHKARIHKGQLEYFNYQRNSFVKIWGGVLTENICQAISRDILCDRMFVLEGNDLPVILHVHDEIVCQSNNSQIENAKHLYDKITNTAPEWFSGFPLKTESEIIERYIK